MAAIHAGIRTAEPGATGEADSAPHSEGAGAANAVPGAPTGIELTEQDFDRATARGALIQAAGMALASMGVREPSGKLLEPLARVVVDLIK